MKIFKSYKNIFIIFTILVNILIISSVVVLTNLLEESDINHVSSENIKEKMQERVHFVDDFFRVYKDYSFELNKKATKYFTKTRTQKEIEDDFVTAIDGLDCIYQVRLLDNNFNELVKVDGRSNIIRGAMYDTRVWEKSELVNKAWRDYFNDFKDLPPNILGVSKMDHNIEHKIVQNRPTIRFGYKIYDKSNPKGYLVINICLKTFLELLQKTTLYDVYLIDGNGDFLLHSENKYSYLENVNAKIVNVNSFPQFQNYKKLEGALELKGFNQLQDIWIVLVNKFYKEKTYEIIEYYLFRGLFVIAIVTVILAYYFGRIPERLTKEIIEQAYIDQHTKLPNRNQLLMDIEGNKENVIILIQIDNIDKILNVYGLKTADTLITKYAKKISSLVETKNYGIVYKIDHSIFALTYFYDGDYEKLQTNLQEIHDKLENEEISCGDECVVYMSVTIGVSDPKDIHLVDDEIVEASLALHKAIYDNKDIIIYNRDNEIKFEYEKALYWTKKLKYAIKNDSVVPFFQPIVDRDGKVFKYECLIRISEDSQVSTPFEFLEIAKTNKLYLQLTRIMIDKVFAIMQHNSYEFSINISMLDIKEDDFLDFILNKIEEYNIKNRLVLEILETEDIAFSDTFESFLIGAKAVGIKISVDDFGTGYSNFERILVLGSYIDYIKIDGSLIKNINIDKNSQILTQNIVNFANEIGIKIIAEFVKNEDVYNFLQQYDIDYYQGYYFGKPEKDLI